MKQLLKNVIEKSSKSGSFKRQSDLTMNAIY
jgi:hypothetical protein